MNDTVKTSQQSRKIAQLDQRIAHADQFPETNIIVDKPPRPPRLMDGVDLARHRLPHDMTKDRALDMTFLFGGMPVAIADEECERMNNASNPGDIRSILGFGHCRE